MNNKNAVMCPRCAVTMIPNNETPGAYPGAISRVDNETEICSSCGLDEALTIWFEDYLAPIEKWPVVLSPAASTLIESGEGR